MTGEIKTDPEQLIRIVNKAEQCCNSLKSDFEQLQDIQKKKSGFWDSEAGRKFQKELQKEIRLMQQVLNELKENYSDLRQIAVNYRQAEAWIENIACLLPECKGID